MIYTTSALIVQSNDDRGWNTQSPMPIGKLVLAKDTLDLENCGDLGPFLLDLSHISCLSLHGLHEELIHRC